ncbi:MAG: hypothetical protein ACUVTR_02490 [Dehalococcoidia bacterium]
MSLLEFTSVAGRLIDAMFDKPPFSLQGRLLAAPPTKNYSTVGTAFGYAMGLQLRNFNRGLVREFPLVAEHGTKGDKKRKQFLKGFNQRKEAFLNGQLDIAELMPDCMILAKLENVARSGRDFPNSEIFSTTEGDIKDLQYLVELVDRTSFTAVRRCILYPRFGQSSLDLGGADADFIIDHTLIEIKTTKFLEFRREYFRQLIGYYILNKRENNMYGELEKLGIYFSRVGKLFTFPIPMMRWKERDAWEMIETAIKEYKQALADCI